MSAVEELLRDIKLPKMVEISQSFDRPVIADVAGEVRSEIEDRGLAAAIRPGMSVAITAGSRGVSNIDTILREIVTICRERGAEPFIIPAMGSHGGSTAEGQREILAGYGITEELMGCPVRCSMDVTRIASFEDGEPVYIDSFAAAADGIIVVGRVKPHTLFRGPVESGICKMMAIGLGKQKGAERCHRQGPYRLSENVRRYGYAILDNSRVLFALGIVENAYDETAVIRAMSREEIRTVEPRLLTRARELMARLMFPACDLLIVDEVGKNISGDGMDPNITGRFIVDGIEGNMDAARIVVLDIAKESHGNGNGIGFADMTTRRAAGKLDREKTYPNGLTSQIMDLTRIPPVFDSDRLCIQAALKTVFGIEDTSKARVIRIRNTAHVQRIQISEALLPQAMAQPAIKVLSEPEEFAFDENGDFF